MTELDQAKSYVMAYANQVAERDGEIYMQKKVIATLTAERDKLREMVVWCVENVAFIHSEGAETYIDCDGTPASILAAVERAMGEK